MLVRSIAFFLSVVIFITWGYAQPNDSYQIPRTELDQPDLQGVWSARFSTMLERPGALPLELSEEQAQGILQAIPLGPESNTDPDIDIFGPQKLAKVKGKYRSSIIVYPENGKLPYNALGTQRSAHSYFGGRGYDGPEQRPGVERCIEAWASPPMSAMMYKLYHGFVQTKDAIAIVSEEASQLRIIHMDGVKRHENFKTFDGYSVGHWEGDTLVVQTTHYSDVNPERATIGRPMLLSSSARVTERFTRISEKELNYQFTVDDPTYYTEPWQGEFSFTREDLNHIYEYSCHEGNYSMVGALRGARVQEANAELEQ